MMINDSSIDRQGIQLSKIRFQRRKSQIIDSSASLFPSQGERSAYADFLAERGFVDWCRKL